MCVVLELGLTEYQEAYKLQRTLQRQRVEGKISDVLLLLEHPPTITIGKSGTLDNVLVSGDKLFQQGIALFFIDRGGDVTYHGQNGVFRPIVGSMEQAEILWSHATDRLRKTVGRMAEGRPAENDLAEDVVGDIGRIGADNIQR